MSGGMRKKKRNEPCRTIQRPNIKKKALWKAGRYEWNVDAESLAS